MAPRIDTTMKWLLVDIDPELDLNLVGGLQSTGQCPLHRTCCGNGGLDVDRASRDASRQGRDTLGTDKVGERRRGIVDHQRGGILAAVVGGGDGVFQR